MHGYYIVSFVYCFYRLLYFFMIKESCIVTSSRIILLSIGLLNVSASSMSSIMVSRNGVVRDCDAKDFKGPEVRPHQRLLTAYIGFLCLRMSGLWLALSEVYKQWVVRIKCKNHDAHYHFDSSQSIMTHYWTRFSNKCLPCVPQLRNFWPWSTNDAQFAQYQLEEPTSSSNSNNRTCPAHTVLAYLTHTRFSS